MASILDLWWGPKNYPHKQNKKENIYIKLETIKSHRKIFFLWNFSQMYLKFLIINVIIILITYNKNKYYLNKQYENERFIISHPSITHTHTTYVGNIISLNISF